MLLDRTAQFQIIFLNTFVKVSKASLFPAIPVYYQLLKCSSQQLPFYCLKSKFIICTVNYMVSLTVISMFSSPVVTRMCSWHLYPSSSIFSMLPFDGRSQYFRVLFWTFSLHILPTREKTSVFLREKDNLGNSFHLRYIKDISVGR